MKEILIPQINANENAYTIREILCEEGDKVEENRVIALVSSSKSVVEIRCTEIGYIHILKKNYDEVSVNQILAFIFEDKNEYDLYIKKESEKNANGKTAEYTLTKLAKQFAIENGITEDEIKKIGKKLIKTSDLEEILKTRENNHIKYITLSQNQKAVANTVINSMQNIPQAFQLVKVECSKCQEAIKHLTEKMGTPVGYSELMVVMLQEMFEDYPIFFSKYEGDKIRLSDEPCIGVTVDVGNGLFIPVIKASQAKNIEEVVELMYEYKFKAFSGDFNAECLDGGNISVSLNTETGVVCVVPFIVPGQVAMISIGAVMTELAYDENHNIVERQYFNMGLAYDHRIINGFQAMNFTNELIRRLETVNIKIKNY